MKNKITLLVLFAFLSLGSWAQTYKISITNITPSVEAGGTLTLDYQYTSPVICNVALGVYLYDEDANGNWVFKSTVVFESKNSLPAGTNLTGKFTVVIPIGTKPSSQLTGNFNYKVIPVLTTGVDTWRAGVYTENYYTITGPYLGLTSLPTNVAAGGVLNVNYKYDNYVAGGKITFVITKNGVGANLFEYISTVAYIESAPTVIGTNITGSFSISIPADTTPTSMLTAPQNYIVNAQIFNAAGVYIGGDYRAGNPITIGPSLGIDDKEIANGLAVYPNPVTDYLNLKNIENLSNEAGFRILNVSGQTVQKSKKLNNDNIDVSNLEKGVYILSIDSKEAKKQLKFIKK